jgi:hypothetical protein
MPSKSIIGSFSKTPVVIEPHPHGRAYVPPKKRKAVTAITDGIRIGL